MPIDTLNHHLTQIDRYDKEWCMLSLEYNKTCGSSSTTIYRYSQRIKDYPVSNNYRFGDYVQQMTICQKKIKYDELTPELDYDIDGNVIPHKPSKIRLTVSNMLSVLEDYLGIRFKEQFRTVAPLSVYLVLFQIVILRQNIDNGNSIMMGLMMVILGLMMFMEGLKVGLMPFGEMIGRKLPERSSLTVVMIVAFLLGIGVTLAEPAIGALKAAGSNVQVTKAPYLFAILNEYPEFLVAMVGTGVGCAVVLGTLRFLYGWSLKPYIYIATSITLFLTIILAMDKESAKVLGLAWDCGAVTTGPVTVPLVLSLGIGVAGAAGKNKSSLSGFGIVTLASLFPIIAVMLLTIFIMFTTTPDVIIDVASHLKHSHETPWYTLSPYQEIIGGIRAIVPLVLFLYLVMRFLLGEKVSDPRLITYGIVLSVIGMIVFSIGLTFGLTTLGNQSGSIMPAAFMSIEDVPGSPLYVYMLGLKIALLFAFFLGFGATLAEPALNALGLTVENLTNGVFKKSTLMYAVSFGVAMGIALGIAKIIFSIPLYYVILPTYLIGMFLTYISTEEYVNVAWDSAGVTTGPVTVPLVLALGLGVGGAVDAIEGFGVLSFASIGPIISVLLTGLYIEWKVKRESHL